MYAHYESITSQHPVPLTHLRSLTRYECSVTPVLSDNDVSYLMGDMLISTSYRQYDKRVPFRPSQQ